MPVLLGKIGAYITGFLVIVIIIQGTLIYNYRDEIKDLATDILVGEINVANLEDGIKKCNLATEKIQLDTKANNEAFKKSQKTEIVVKYINKYLPPKDNNATDCENINDILANVRYFGL